jgi:enediyne biosynthesis protein E4
MGCPAFPTIETMLPYRPAGPLYSYAQLGLLAVALVSWAGCRPAAGPPVAAATPVQFVDITKRAGARFRHTNGESGRLYFAETLGSGCAFLDYNGDGRLDLFFVNSSRLPGFSGKGAFYPALYHNEGNGRFRDVTQQAGLTIDCYGMGVACADADNDGDTDLLLTAYGGSRLFRNDHGRFTEVTRQAGITKPEWGSSAAWFDYDRDGDLDLFIASYLDWSPAKNRLCGEGGRPYACDPTYYDGTASVLYRNNGNGTFSDVTQRAGLDRGNGKALGVVLWDPDDDGWADLAVANDSQPNWLFHNNGDGTFREIGVEAGIAYGAQGKARAGMGIDTADYNHSGREALLIGNLSGEGLAFFHSGDTPSQFTDKAAEAGLFQVSLPFGTFGARFLDFDLDGYADILTANGHVNREVQSMSGSYTFAQPMLLLHNEAGDGGARRFQDVTAAAGAALNTPMLARGLAIGDVDGDGDPDALVNQNNGPGLLLENAGPPRGHWLALRLIGERSNRDGIGARVQVTAGGQTQRGWVRSGGSYASEDERVARFGLGEQTRVDQLEVRWPSGTVDRMTGVPANQTLILREGETGQKQQTRS